MTKRKRPAGRTQTPTPEAELSTTEMAWLEAHWDELAARYPGQWVAVDGEALVAYGPDLLEVLRLAAAAGHPDPFVTALPEDPAMPVFA